MGIDESGATESALAPSDGQVLAGRYEILGILGSGGMGTVYRARDRELDEVVALKMLRRELVDMPGMLTRFRTEAKLARKVTHTNVARTFDLGEHAGARFLTMEYVDGESLAMILTREKRLPLARVVDLVTPLCAGLTAAHAAGVVHRDLKPDNVLVARDGRVVVTDFGIARALTSDGRQTMGAAIGTPVYMAPEQVEAAPIIDARADVYALGAMLFELLTGSVPWDGDSAYAIAARRLVAPPPDPRDVARDVPDAFAAVVMRCMARRPEDRYASAAEVAAALGSVTLPAGLSVPVTAAVHVVPAAAASSPSVTTTLEKTVAVLPFRNAGSPDDDYLAAGLTDDMIDTLSMNPQIRVRSRGAVMRFKGVEGDPQEIGRQLAVQVVANGSVRRMGDNLRVAVTLVSVEDGFQLWAKRFDRPPNDVLAVGDEAAAAIAEALTVDWREAPRAAPTNRAAVDLFLRARYEFGKRSKESSQNAIQLYELALEKAPRDPSILAHYAIALARMHALASGDEGATFAEKARAVVDRALAEAPESGSPHLALGIIELYAGNLVVAVRELRRALALAPNLPEAHETYGRLLIEIGEVDRGLEHLRSTLKLDPRLEQVHFEIARVLALRGHWTECHEILAVPPADSQLFNHYWTARTRVEVWQRDAGRAAASKQLVEGLGFPVKPWALMFLGVAATSRLSDESRAELDSPIAAARTWRRRAYQCQLKAEAVACVGEAETTLATLEAASAVRLVDIFWLDRCPLFDFIRGDARFLAVRKEVAARAAEVVAELTAAT